VACPSVATQTSQPYTPGTRRGIACVVIATVLLAAASLVVAEPKPAAVKKDDAAGKKPAEKPDPAAERFAELRKLYRANPAKAAEGFRKFLTEFPESEWIDDARYWLAMSLDRSRAKRRDVIAAFTDVVAKHPDSRYRDDALFAVAETWRRRARRPEDYNQAVKAYLDFIKRTPKSQRISEAQLKIGEVYQYLGQQEKASAFFNRVIKEHPKSPYTVRAHMKLAVSKLRMKKADEALKIYAKLLEQDLPHRERINVQFGMVDCYLTQKNGMEKAIAICKTIRDEAAQRKSLEDFTEYRTREKMASYYLGRKKYEEAEAEYNTYIARFGKSVGVWQARLNIGTIRRVAGKPAAAREMFHEVVSGYTGDAQKAPWYVIQARYYEAYTYEMEKNDVEARKHYHQLVTLHPKHYYGRRARGKVKKLDAKIAEAKKKATEKKPDVKPEKK